MATFSPDHNASEAATPKKAQKPAVHFKINNPDKKAKAKNTYKTRMRKNNKAAATPDKQGKANGSGKAVTTPTPSKNGKTPGGTPGKTPTPGSSGKPGKLLCLREPGQTGQVGKPGNVSTPTKQVITEVATPSVHDRPEKHGGSAAKPSPYDPPPSSQLPSSVSHSPLVASSSQALYSSQLERSLKRKREDDESSESEESSDSEASSPKRPCQPKQRQEKPKFSEHSSDTDGYDTSEDSSSSDELGQKEVKPQPAEKTQKASSNPALPNSDVLKSAYLALTATGQQFNDPEMRRLESMETTTKYLQLCADFMHNALDTFKQQCSNLDEDVKEMKKALATRKRGHA